jgi:tetratricopeptide (TPR) repeat protein
MPAVDRSTLLDLLDAKLSAENVRDLVFDLDLDWANTGGDASTKRDRLRTLITDFARRGQADALLAAVRRRRPDALSADTTLAASPPNQSPPSNSPRRRENGGGKDVSGEPQVDVAALLKRGEAYLEAKALQRAIDVFSQVIQADPDNADAYRLRGQAYWWADNPARGVEDFTEAILLKPTAQTYEWRARAYYHALNDEYRGMQDFAKALEIDPSYTPAYAARARVYTERKEYDRALADHNRYLALKPRDDSQYAERGKVYELKGDYQRALDDFSKAIQCNARNIWHFIHRADLYRRHFKNYRLAILDYSAALAIEPDHAASLYNRGQTYLDDGDLDHAADDFRRVAALGAEYYGRWAEDKLKDIRKKRGW